MTIHINRTAPKKKPPRSGYTNILSAGKDKYFVRICSIDYPKRYTKDEIPEAVKFRDEMREKLGEPRAEF
jgi:hypothetical protein